MSTPEEVSKLRGSLKAKKRTESMKKRYASRTEYELMKLEEQIAQELKKHL